MATRCAEEVRSGIYYQQAARNIYLSEVFSAVHQEFRKKTIALIPLKGIGFIQGTYSDIGSRYVGDIDILIKPQDVPRASGVLDAAGYEAKGYDTKSIPSLSPYLNSAPFTKPSKVPYFIHLHWHLLNSTIPLCMFTVDMDEVWRKARPVSRSGRSVLALDSAHELVYLSLHAFKHSFNKMSLFTDIEKVILFYGSQLDWENVIMTARRWNAALPLYYALFLTAKKTGAAVPDEVFSAIVPDRGNITHKKIVSLAAKDAFGEHHLVFPLYVNLIRGIRKKLLFLLLSFFPPLSVLKRTAYCKTIFHAPYCYLRRFFWALRQFFTLLFNT